MLREWLGELSVDAFRREHLGRRAFSLPSTARSALPFCSWSALDAILQARPAPDALVVSRGQLVNRPAPRGIEGLRTLFGEGIGLVIRHAQRQHTALEQLAQAFLRDLPGELKLLVFATPRGTHGFSWHFDPEEVFIVQTAGQKEYLFRANTVLTPAQQRHPEPDFSAIRAEKSPLFSCTLHPGDWLHLPRGTWHVARPLEDSLSLSIGVLPERPARIV